LSTVSLDRLVGSALRRLARADFSGAVSAFHRELRVPTSSLGRRLQPAYRATRNFFGRLAYSGSFSGPSDRALYLFYDLEVAPITFDFAWTLVAADLRRRELNLDWLQVVIVPGPIEGGRRESSDYDEVFDAEARNWRLWNIVVDMCRSLSDCSVVVCKSREEAERLFFADARHVFPIGYTPNSPIVVFNEAIEASKMRPGGLGFFSAPVEARRYVRKWMDRHCPGRKLIVFTLRQSRYMQARNSNLASWRAFAAGLDDEKYHVALIPDTDAASEWSESWPNTTPVLEACFNLQIRQAFYQCGYLSMGVNSGPLMLPFFNSAAAVAMFIMVRENVPQASSAYLPSRGFVHGQTPIFCTPKQRWVWEEDTLENLQLVFSNLINIIEQDCSSMVTDDRFPGGLPR
jgi:hypothetical protein